MDIQQAAEKQKLNIKEVVKEIKEEIRNHEMQIEEANELSRKCKKSIEVARNDVQTTIEDLQRVLEKHKNDMLTKLNDIEEDEERDRAKQSKHIQESLKQLKTDSDDLEAMLERNDSVEILKPPQNLDEWRKDLFNAERNPVYKPLHVSYEENGDVVVQRVKGVLGQVVTHNLKTVSSVAEGKGLEEAEVGRESYFTITTQDSKEEQVYNPDDVKDVKVQTPFRKELIPYIVDNKNGTYTVSYTPDCDGKHDVTIAVNGEPLTGSPWSVHVAPHQYQFVDFFGSRGKAKGQFEGPCDIATNEQTGNIAVADAKNNSVQLFSSDGLYLSECDKRGPGKEELTSPISVGFTRSGDLVIIRLASCEILHFSESDHLVRKKIPSKHLKDPRFMSVTCDDQMVVCDWGDNRVKVLSPDGTKLLQTFRAPDCDESPWFAVYHQDKLFVCYGLDHVVKVFNKDGKFQQNIGTIGSGDGQLSYPTGIAIDKFNNLVVCDSGNQRLQVFTLDGTFVNTVTGLKCPGSVAVSSSTGKLFVTDFTESCVHVLQ